MSVQVGGAKPVGELVDRLVRQVDVVVDGEARVADAPQLPTVVGEDQHRGAGTISAGRQRPGFVEEVAVGQPGAEVLDRLVDVGVGGEIVERFGCGQCGETATGDTVDASAADVGGAIEHRGERFGRRDDVLAQLILAVLGPEEPRDDLHTTTLIGEGSLPPTGPRGEACAYTSRCCPPRGPRMSAPRPLSTDLSAVARPPG